MDERPAPSDSAEGPVGAYLVATEPIARRIADALAEALDPQEATSAAVAEPDGTWGVEITFQRAPDEAAVRALVSIAAGEECADALCFRPLARQDWVASSLAGLDPVVAGRFVVHGAHSRTQVGPNRIGIEIEAALAFGTGHHGTTRGCLLALDRVVKRHGRKRVRRSQSTRPYRILDLGTGSGALLCATLSEFPRAFGIGVDQQERACRIARENLAACRLAARGVIVCGNWGAALAGGFDLVVANPPYIASGAIGTLAPEVRDHDPRPALDGGPDGLAAYRAIAADLDRLLAPDGTAIVEIGHDQAESAPACFRQAGWSSISLKRDLENQPRALVLRR